MSERILNLAYTDNGNGDGWLVLSRMDNLAGPVWSKEARCGAWNLLSPLFNGRRAVAAKLKTYRAACEPIGELPFGQGRVAIHQAEATALYFGVLDGPLAMTIKINLSMDYGYETTVRRTAMQRACLTGAALSVYRHDHGQYPNTLDSIVGNYLSSAPIDPYNGEPLHYRVLDGGRDFLLYAVGPNEKDDDGVKVAPEYSSSRSQRKEDVVFYHTRPKPNWEPKLEPSKK